MPRYYVSAEYQGQTFHAQVLETDTKWFTPEGRRDITNRLNEILNAQIDEWVQLNRPFIYDRNVQVQTLDELIAEQATA